MGKEGDEQFYRELELAEKEQELPAEVQEKMKKGMLRTGYTTGTAACAATKAALHALITGKSAEEVTVSLPKGRTAVLKVAWTTKQDGAATSGVIKDGGDDPDVTSGAEICSTVSFNANVGAVNIEGG
ncbi:MAG: cobalt-precorrin-5B (C(1))-methyltransferase, partial [Nitrososphaera sp.]